MNRTITLSDIEPAPLSIRHPLGVNLDLNLTMLMQNGTPAQLGTVEPQFVLLPRSKGGVRPYDMTIIDAVNGNTRIQIPGYDLNDVSGYGIELYTREAAPGGGTPVPIGLAAKGALVTQGSAYASDAPLSIINMPMVVGPPGPAGAAGAAGAPGAPGTRGSVWFTGSGAPGVIAGAQPADMYLDEANGDVYRYDGAVWTRGTF